MADREKVIKGLTHCTAWAGLHECQPKVGEDCPYVDEADCKLTIMRDALELLKEQPEIVRCKDCIHWDNLTKFCGTHSSCFTVQRTLPDWFCADGERRYENA